MQDPLLAGNAHSTHWASEIVALLDRIPYADPDAPHSSLALVYVIPTAWFRRLVQRIGRDHGLDAVHDFVRRAVFAADALAARVQQATGRRLSRRGTERLEQVLRAYGLGIAYTYRMRSLFQPLFQLFFRHGETDVALIADYLQTLVGTRTALAKLFRKLASRDPELREYALYIIAEFATEPEFGAYVPRLRERLANETNEFVREAYEYLFDFVGGV